APGPLEQELERLRRVRLKLLEEQEKLAERGGLPAASQRELARVEFESELGQFERALREYEARPWESIRDDPNDTELERRLKAFQRLDRQNRFFVRVHRLFLSLIEEAFRERQEQVRSNWPRLPALCVEGVDLLSADEDTAMAAVTRAALTN